MSLLLRTSVNVCRKFRQEVAVGIRAIASVSDSVTNQIDDKLCDVSRLPDHVLKPASPRTVDDKRELFGKLGLASNIDPSLSWPGRDEFDQLVKFQGQFEQPLESLITASRQENDCSAKALKEREEKVVKAMATMPDLIAKFHAKRARRAGEISKIDEKRQALLDEAREYFGYELSPRDPRFLELVERKQEEEKRLKKKMRKEKRVERTVLSLTGGQVSTAGPSSSSKQPNETASDA